MLLFHVKGPKSFKDLRTINGDIKPTFKEACKEYGLLLDD